MNEKPLFQEKSEQKFFIQIIQTYLPFWPLFVLTIGISMSVSYIYLRSQIPIYVANAKVLLKDPNKGGGDSKVLDALNIFSEKKIVDNEILVLKSSSILQVVVKDLNLYASVYNKGKVKLEELYGENSPVSFITTSPDSILNFNKFIFTINWKNKNININNMVVPFDGNVLLGNVNFHLFVNDSYNQNVKGKNYFVNISPVAAVSSGISGSIRANPLSNVSTVLDIKIETPQPLKGEAILTRLFEVYNSQGIEDKNMIASKTLAFIEDRLRLVISQLDSVEKNIVSYQSKQSMYKVGEQGTLFLANVKDLDKRKGEIDLQLEILNSIKNYVQSKGKNNGTVPSLNLIADPVVNGLVQQLYAAEFERDKAIQISGEQSESVLLTKEKVRRLKTDIQESLTNIKNNLVTIKNDIEVKTNSNNSLLSQVPQKERGLLDL